MSQRVPRAPHWARWMAYLVPVCVLPSGLWRIAMGMGIPVGYSSERMSAEGYPGWGTVYVVLLAVLVQGLALLTIGLVQRWGEVPPRWVPLLGGRRMRPKIVTGVAGTGAVLLTLLTLSQLILWQSIDESTLGSEDLTGQSRLVMGLCYLPLLAWGPLLGAVTWDYHRRNRTVGRTR